MMHPDELEEMNYNRDDAEYRAVMIADNHDTFGDMEATEPLTPEQEAEVAAAVVALEARRAADAEAELDGSPF